MMYFIYSALLFILSPLLRLWILYRKRKGKEDPVRFKERFGIPSIVRPKGTIWWFHGASIGECLTFLPIINYFHKHDRSLNFLVTSGTVTSQYILKKRLPSRCSMQFVPLDDPVSVHKFLKFWNPAAGFWVESDFWPRLIIESRKIMSLILLNGKLSESSFKRWQYLQSFFQKILNSFIVIFPQSPSYKEKFDYFVKDKTIYLGNLKYMGEKLYFNSLKVNMLKEDLESRLIWVAANTHEGEEEIILNAYKELKIKFENLVLILIPRHHDRLNTIIKLIEKNNFSYQMHHSSMGRIRSDIYVVDTYGEMGLFYSVVDVVFMAGSLLPNIGGHNILEAAHFEKVILFGPYMENNLNIAELFLKNNAAIQLENASTSQLVYKMEKVLKSSNDRATYIKNVTVTLEKTDMIGPLITEIQFNLNRFQSS